MDSCLLYYNPFFPRHITYGVLGDDAVCVCVCTRTDEHVFLSPLLTLLAAVNYVSSGELYYIKAPRLPGGKGRAAMTIIDLASG